MTDVNLNITESINSFIRPLRIRLSSKEQILAKVTMVAVAAILIAGNLPPISAYSCNLLSDCFAKCPMGPINECVMQCMRDCCAIENCARECVKVGFCKQI
ncbi:MAG: hypothetical protein ACRCU0_02835 [Candidatus Rhabdochlamydia sp.]